MSPGSPISLLIRIFSFSGRPLTASSISGARRRFEHDDIVALRRMQTVRELVDKDVIVNAVVVLLARHGVDAGIVSH